MRKERFWNINSLLSHSTACISWLILALTVTVVLNSVPTILSWDLKQIKCKTNLMALSIVLRWNQIETNNHRYFHIVNTSFFWLIFSSWCHDTFELLLALLLTCGFCIPRPQWTGFIMLRYLWRTQFHSSVRRCCIVPRNSSAHFQDSIDLA